VLINIQLVYALADDQQCVSLSVPDGTRARDALIHALEKDLIVLADSDAQHDPMELPIGVYGKCVEDDYQLRQAERLEIYRPLLQDPKERRRKIARQT
jgi:putative ubiquitin-RnfH superfamily antitoxin RatB of RatAB toxin-antitoxin module